MKEDVVLDRSNDGKVHMGIQMDENGICLFVNGVDPNQNVPFLFEGWKNDGFDTGNVHLVMDSNPRYENHVSLLGVFFDVSGTPVRSLLKKMNRLNHFKSHVHGVVALKSVSNSNIDAIHNIVNGNLACKQINDDNSTFRLRQDVPRPHIKIEMLSKNTADIIEGETIMYRSARTCRYDIIKSNGYFNGGIHYWEIAVNGNLNNMIFHLV